MPRIRKILVANRGEIARRVLRTVRAMGIGTVAVFSDADADAPYVREAGEAVRIGPPPSRESYLSIDRILEAARATGADAVHPGYGFLSENAAFTEAVLAEGLTWVGPDPTTIAAMGSKLAARGLMEDAGLPVLPGAPAGRAGHEVLADARRLGLPLLVKASAGGGGKGMRVVRDEAELERAVAAARREAASAFVVSCLAVGTVSAARVYVAAPRSQITVSATRRGRSAVRRAAMAPPSAGPREKSSPYRVKPTTRFPEDAEVIPTTVKRRSFLGAIRLAVGVGASCQLKATPGNVAKA